MKTVPITLTFFELNEDFPEAKYGVRIAIKKKHIPHIIRKNLAPPELFAMAISAEELENPETKGLHVFEFTNYEKYEMSMNPAMIETIVDDEHLTIIAKYVAIVMKKEWKTPEPVTIKGTLEDGDDSFFIFFRH